MRIKRMQSYGSGNIFWSSKTDRIFKKKKKKKEKGASLIIRSRVGGSRIGSFDSNIRDTLNETKENDLGNHNLWFSETVVLGNVA